MTDAPAPAAQPRAAGAPACSDTEAVDDIQALLTSPDGRRVGGVLWYGLTHAAGKATSRSRSASSSTGLSAGPRGMAEAPPAPRPPSARSWTSIWLDGSRPAEPCPRRPDHGPRTKRQSGLHSAQWCGQPRRSADAGPFRAQSLRDDPCRPAGPACPGSAGRPTAQRPERAPRWHTDREGRSLRTQTARR